MEDITEIAVLGIGNHREKKAPLDVIELFPISGFKKRWAHTKAETGLPGSPTKIVLLFFPAKIGFPGLMATL